MTNTIQTTPASPEEAVKIISNVFDYEFSGTEEFTEALALLGWYMLNYSDAESKQYLISKEGEFIQNEYLQQLSRYYGRMKLALEPEIDKLINDLLPDHQLLNQFKDRNYNKWLEEIRVIIQQKEADQEKDLKGLIDWVVSEEIKETDLYIAQAYYRKDYTR